MGVDGPGGFGEGVEPGGRVARGLAFPGGVKGGLPQVDPVAPDCVEPGLCDDDLGLGLISEPGQFEVGGPEGVGEATADGVDLPDGVPEGRTFGPGGEPGPGEGVEGRPEPEGGE